MKIQSDKWKIYQTGELEFILLSNGENGQKLSGEHSSKIVEILDYVQHSSTYEEVEYKIRGKFEPTMALEILDWLQFNQFFATVVEDETYNINVVGEFSDDENLVEDFLLTMPKGIQVNNIVNLSRRKELTLIEGQLTILVAPFWYNNLSVSTLSEVMLRSHDDFLYVELYNNGIVLGPLLNKSKGTACLNCVQIRKLINVVNPSLILENILQKKLLKENNLNVLKIGHYQLNKTLIYNELEKIILRKSKSMYNKSVFIDFVNYDNQCFNVIKAPNCQFCNTQIVYNPL